MKTKVQLFQNESVEHDTKCHNTACFLSKTHRRVFFFETQDVIYYAHDIHDAATMWVEGGCKQLTDVGSVG